MRLNLARVAFLVVLLTECKLQRSLQLAGGACVPCKIDILALLIKRNLFVIKLQTTVQIGDSLNSTRSMTSPVSKVDDVAQCRRESTVVLDLILVLLSARLVQLRVNECLHRVKVQEVLRDSVVWI